MNWPLLTGHIGPEGLVAGAAGLPGLVLVVAWLIRLAHWQTAKRATGNQVVIWPCLARSANPRTGGSHPPIGQAFWVRIGSEPRARYQRLIWEPWVSTLEDRCEAVLHAGPVGVIDIPGKGRLWPASNLLSRKPMGVRLVPFSAADNPAGRGEMLARLAFTMVAVLAACICTTGLWGIPYAASLAVAAWLWFGVVPPTWLPHSAAP